MMNPKVTVIIPVYNMERYLKECLDSVMKQDLENIEILFIDDGSTDTSPEILDDAAKNDIRIRVIHRENQGVAVSRNIGIKKAKGTYVAFMDPDDYYPGNDVLGSLYDAAISNNAVIAGGEFSDITPDGTIRCGEDFDNEFLFGYTFEREGMINYIDYQFDYGFHRFIYQKDFLIRNKISFPILSRFQDPPFMVEAMYKAGQFYAMKKVVYRYRINHKETQWTNPKMADLLYGLLLNLKKAEEYQLFKLQELTTKRICIEYRSVLLDISDRLSEMGPQEKSISYRLGLCITYIPRKIFHIIMGDYRHDRL